MSFCALKDFGAEKAEWEYCKRGHTNPSITAIWLLDATARTPPLPHRNAEKGNKLMIVM